MEIFGNSRKGKEMHGLNKLAAKDSSRVNLFDANTGNTYMYNEN